MSVISNIPLTEIETTLQPLLGKIAEAVHLIAPEREDSLKELSAKLDWEYELEGKRGGFGFAARQGTGKNVVCVPLAALERLWAFVFGHLVLFELARSQSIPGVVDTPDVPGARVAKELVAWAYSGRSNRLPWPQGCPSPGNPMHWTDEVAKTQQFFLGAVGFIVLHELAHLEHQDPPAELQSDYDSQRCELRADEWAAKWIMEKLGNRVQSPASPDALKHLWIFRANCIVHALCVINAVEFHSVGGRKTHPEPLERLLNCAEKFFPESGEQVAPATDFPVYLAATICATQHVNLISVEGADTIHDSITSALVDLLQRFSRFKSGETDSANEP